MNIKTIHYLRGFAALCVVLYHLKYYLNNIYPIKDLGDILFKFGAFGVDLFFIISGFILCVATEDKLRNTTVSYLCRRFFRIYPLLFFCMFFYYFTFNFGADTHPFIRGVIPLNADYNAGAPFFGWNVLIPAWTLSYEVMFYFIFLIAMVINHDKRFFLTSLIIITFITVIQLIYTHEVSLIAYNKNSFANGHWYHGVVTFLASPLFFDFIYGMIIYKIYCFVLSNAMKLSKYHLIFITITAFYCMTTVILYMNAGHGPLRWGITSFFIVLSFVLIETQINIRESKVMTFLGNVSYSLYLSHEIIIRIIISVADKYNYSSKITGLYAVIPMTFICLAIAFLLHKFIELPFISIGRLLTSNRKLASN